MNKRKLLISFNMNIAIIVMTIIALGVATLDIQIQKVSYASLFIYYTTLSNLFLFVASIISFVYQLLIITKKKLIIPNWVNIVKLCAVTTTTITFLVVIFFLTPVMSINTDPEALKPEFLYMGSNCIFHVLNPVVGIICFLLFDHTDQIKLPQVCFSMIFTAIYGIFYALDIVFKFVTLTKNHDWYNFLILVNGNTALIPLIVIIFIGLTFLVSWLLWLGNRKINIMEIKKTATK